MKRIAERISAGVFVAAGLSMAGPAAAQQVTFMTGPQGGSWVPLGGALMNMWEKAIPGLQIQQTPGAGIANVRGVDEGKAQIGFGNSSTTVDGIDGRAPYPKKVDQGLPGGEPVSAVLPGGRARRRQGQLVRRPQGQVGGDAAQGQHRRDR